jgi:hypothetical protein
VTAADDFQVPPADEPEPELELGLPAVPDPVYQADELAMEPPHPVN